ncbi:MAG: hypothetical protein R3208_03170 [Ketobacteraceae bacterium]|nr:hypothetical protein [Ketobacteraceae bacterium]
MSDFSDQLALQGLNLQAVISLDTLPDPVRDTLADAVNELAAYRQLLLLGHGGTRLWNAVNATGITSADPIDDYTAAVIRTWFRQSHPGVRHHILYPGTRLVPLQTLGELCGWHFPSPIMVGVNDEWGSWYAYRAAVLADTAFATTPPPDWKSACEPCEDKPCVKACPAAAVSPQGLDMHACIEFRRQPASPCQKRCLARLACPVGRAHQYSREQIEYHYGRSLDTINKFS